MTTLYVSCHLHPYLASEEDPPGPGRDPVAASHRGMSQWNPRLCVVVLEPQQLIPIGTEVGVVL